MAVTTTFVVNAYNYTKLNDRMGFAVNGSYHHNDGFFRNAFDGSKIDKFNDGFLRGRFYWKPARRWTLTADVSYRNSDQEATLMPPTILKRARQARSTITATVPIFVR